MLILGFDRGCVGTEKGRRRRGGQRGLSVWTFFHTLEIPRPKKTPTRVPDIPRYGCPQDPDWSGAQDGGPATLFSGLLSQGPGDLGG